MGLLREMGYTNLKAYSGGMADWLQGGGPVATGAAAPARPAERGAAPRRSPLDAVAGTLLGFFDRITDRSLRGLLALWLAMVVAFGLVYWLGEMLGWGSLVLRDTPLPMTASGLATAIYFSFVTAMTVGYGDVVPAGFMRVPAILEALGGFLLFGYLIAKLVARRQERLTEEIHRITFEDRLDRVRTNLHLVLSELQSLAAACQEQERPPARILARAESAVVVFVGELRAIHDLLYRPQQAPEEAALAGILASLAAALAELRILLDCSPPDQPRSPAMTAYLGDVRRLAAEICGDCVPREYAPELRGVMDRIQGLARVLTE